MRIDTLKLYKGNSPECYQILVRGVDDPIGQGELRSLIYLLFMMYLINLEDRKNNCEVMIECEEDMKLEELYRKIKYEFFLPRHGEIGHSFHTNGQILVTNPEVLQERWLAYGNNVKPRKATYGSNEEDELILKDPEFLNSNEICLNEVFTIKGSAILFQQIHRRFRFRIYCTLTDCVR